MSDTDQQQSRTKLVAIVVTVLVVAGAVILIDYLKSHKSTDNTVATPSAQPENTHTSNETSDAGLKDGTYTASKDYIVPEGDQTIKVNLTLQSGTITAVSIQNSENGRESTQYQEDFADGYKAKVVGKKINGLEVKIFAGASDTVEAFNDALNKIVSQAKV